MAEKQKIMIVDDDTNISNLVSLYLKKECFDTICVDDGEKAVKVVAVTDKYESQLGLPREI